MTQPAIALVWENFGPSHFDRIRACVAAGYRVIAIEFNASSLTYQWERGDVVGAEQITLSASERRIGGAVLTWKLVRTVWRARAGAVFLCHYQNGAVFAAAILLRLLGVQVFTMVDSKFDDYPRFLWREAGKALLFAPYHGAIAGSRRTRDYLHFLGLMRRPVVSGFDTLDLARIRAAAPNGLALPHAARDFLIVSRLVRKKNLAFALRAYAKWREGAIHPRRLRLVGYGEEEAALRALTAELGIAGSVIFEGQVDSRRVGMAMASALCLILPSIEEQFGLVVIEALALGLPVLVSANAGAVDELIDNGVNGWIIDPYRPAALEATMALLDRDAATWERAAAAARASSGRADVGLFVLGVGNLLAGLKPDSRLPTSLRD